ncbi:MAG: glyoxalase/bleomycin resistance/dioxygenase family protein [Xenococcaceae cyanobacterium]
MPLSEFPISSILIHVDNPTDGIIWYQKAFPEAKKCFIAEFDFEYLDYLGIAIEIVPADNKVSSGAAGSVVYWLTNNFQKRLDHLLKLGAILYRGPMNVEKGFKMCQVKDLWGNCIGLKGK